MAATMRDQQSPFLRPSDATVSDFINPEGQPRRTIYYQSGWGGPEGFCVGVAPEGFVTPHFHSVDQFHVVLGSPGTTYKTQTVGEGFLMIQYSDAFNVYGPMDAGSETPLEFFSFRAHYDTAIGFLPKDRDLLQETPRHRKLSFLVDLAARGAGPADSASLLDHYDDGLAAYRLRAVQGRQLSGPPLAGTSGQYYMVIGGEVTHRGSAFGPRSIAWVGPDDQPLELGAEHAEGFDVLVLQFADPTPLPAAGSDAA